MNAYTSEYSLQRESPHSEVSSGLLHAQHGFLRFHLGRIIILFVAAGCHFASSATVLVELTSRVLPNSLAYYRSKVMNATLISLDFAVLALLIGWSVLQLLIAYRLSGKNVVKATALCWIVTCVEALYLVLFVYGLYGGSPSEDSSRLFPAASVVFTLLVGWQFVFSVVVSTFIGANFRSFRSSPGVRCGNSNPEYELIA